LELWKSRKKTILDEEDKIRESSEVMIRVFVIDGREGDKIIEQFWKLSQGST
jgi:hypothetical protein